MNRKKLSNKQQIKILENVVNRIEDGECFICNAIVTELTALRLKANPNNCNLYIPLMTRENAKIACIEGEVTLPWEKQYVWWYYMDRTSRIYFLKWMIKKLQE